MGKRLIFMVFMVMFLGVASEVILPKVMSTVVNQGMMNLTGSGHVSTEFVKKPAVLMLGGEFDKITILADNAKVDKIMFSKLSIVLTDAKLDMLKLVNSKVIDLQSVNDITIAATVTQEDLAQYLNNNVKGVKNATVLITPEKVKASSNFAIGGLVNVTVNLEGRIVGDGQKIKFVTDKILINNTLTGNIGGGLLTDIAIVELNKLPFNVNVSDIIMENGKVTIYLVNHLR